MKDLLEQAADMLDQVATTVRGEDDRIIGAAVGVLRAAALAWPGPVLDFASVRLAAHERADALAEQWREGFDAGIEAARDLDPEGYRDGWTAGALAARGLLLGDGVPDLSGDVIPPPDGAAWVDGVGKVYVYRAAATDWLEIERPVEPETYFDLNAMDWQPIPTRAVPESVVEPDAFTVTDSAHVAEEAIPADRDPLRAYRPTDLREHRD